ncbi:MAG: hypothetical protein FJ304_00840 [Planctomycetes bacterium]|nr:hypothetical protein [Planctomycetota bacterium]
MLSLDDPRWHELWTGYSVASRFLPALRRLWEDPTTAKQVVSEFDSENYVCHQCSVYHTTLAVIPHFIYAAGRLPPGQRRELLSSAGLDALLLGVPFGAREEMPEPPEWLVADYDSAVRDAVPLTCEALVVPPSGPDAERDRLQLMAALAGFQGQHRLGCLLQRATGWFMCRWCEAEFDLLVELGQSVV